MWSRPVCLIAGFASFLGLGGLFAAAAASAQGIVLQQPRLEQLAQGKLKNFGAGYVVVDTDDRGDQTIAVGRDTYVSITLEMPVTDIPPGAQVRVSGDLDPRGNGKITNWRMSYHPQMPIAGNWVYISEGASTWEVHYCGNLSATTPMRLATQRGTGYYVRPQSSSTNSGPPGMNIQRPSSQPIRNPRSDLEGAIFTLDMADAEDRNVTVYLRNQPQMAGNAARVFVWGVKGNPPLATSVSIMRTEPFELPKPTRTTKKK